MCIIITQKSLSLLRTLNSVFHVQWRYFLFFSSSRKLYDLYSFFRNYEKILIFHVIRYLSQCFLLMIVKDLLFQIIYHIILLTYYTNGFFVCKVSSLLVNNSSSSGFLRAYDYQIMLFKYYDAGTWYSSSNNINSIHVHLHITNITPIIWYMWAPFIQIIKLRRMKFSMYILNFICIIRFNVVRGIVLLYSCIDI